MGVYCGVEGIGSSLALGAKAAPANEAKPSLGFHTIGVQMAGALRATLSYTQVVVLSRHHHLVVEEARELGTALGVFVERLEADGAAEVGELLLEAQPHAPPEVVEKCGA